MYSFSFCFLSLNYLQLHKIVTFCFTGWHLQHIHILHFLVSVRTDIWVAWLAFVINTYIKTDNWVCMIIIRWSNFSFIMNCKMETHLSARFPSLNPYARRGCKWACLRFFNLHDKYAAEWPHHTQLVMAAVRNSPPLVKRKKWPWWVCPSNRELSLRSK